MKIQVIGLPGSGKSHSINKYLKLKKQNNIEYFDIAQEVFTKNIKNINREKLFKQKIMSSKKHVIAESACGVYLPASEVVRLDVEARLRHQRYLDREGEEMDLQHENHLSQSMIPATYIVNSEQALFDILDTLINKG